MQQMEARQVCACNTPVLVGARKQQILSTRILRKQLARNNFPWNAALRGAALRLLDQAWVIVYGPLSAKWEHRLHN